MPVGTFYGKARRYEEEQAEEVRQDEEAVNNKVGLNLRI